MIILPKSQRDDVLNDLHDWYPQWALGKFGRLAADVRSLHCIASTAVAGAFAAVLRFGENLLRVRSSK
jgi:hypothetical protein